LIWMCEAASMASQGCRFGPGVKRLMQKESSCLTAV
jgi:hypothetical protein